MLEQICAHIHNYFTDPDDIRPGEYTIEGGAIELPFLKTGQYFRILGSALNDGVYQYPVDATDAAQALADETFEGEIWPMKVPKAVRALAAEIALWQEKYGAAVASPFQSESVIGVYSYTKQGGNTAVNGAAADAGGWQAAFKSRLNPWRCLY